MADGFLTSIILSVDIFNLKNCSTVAIEDILSEKLSLIRYNKCSKLSLYSNVFIFAIFSASLPLALAFKYSFV